jgi:V/A-type H+-transporting ATPase subunit E
MEELDTGKDKIKQICDLLRHETLEPAKNQAQKIIDEANQQAEKIIAEAKRQSETLLHEARAEIERERNVFYSSLTQAAKQGVDALKNEIEKQLFHVELEKVIGQRLAEPEVIAKLIDSLVKAIERDGVSADFSTIIPQQISTNDLNQYLLEQNFPKLKEGISLGEFSGGIKLKLKDKNITIDASDKAVVELLEKYLRKDFRKWLFGSVK